MHFFELCDDMSGVPRWHLDEVLSIDGTVHWLRTGERCNQTDLHVAVHHAGPSLQFTLSTFGVPIAVSSLATVVAALAQNDVQILPCAVDGNVGYDVVNVLRILPCIDDTLSVGTRWTKHDHRADLAGQYRVIDKLVLKSAIISESSHIFRLQDYRRLIIVSETMKQAMEAAGCHGAVFVPVELS